jgi:hypothetical protein
MTKTKTPKVAPDGSKIFITPDKSMTENVPPQFRKQFYIAAAKRMLEDPEARDAILREILGITPEFEHVIRRLMPSEGAFPSPAPVTAFAPTTSIPVTVETPRILVQEKPASATASTPAPVPVNLPAEPPVDVPPVIYPAVIQQQDHGIEAGAAPVIKVTSPFDFED